MTSVKRLGGFVLLSFGLLSGYWLLGSTGLEASRRRRQSDAGASR